MSSISPLTDEGGGAASDDVLRSGENLRIGLVVWFLRIETFEFWFVGFDTYVCLFFDN